MSKKWKVAGDIAREPSPSRAERRQDLQVNHGVRAMVGLQTAQLGSRAHPEPVCRDRGKGAGGQDGPLV